MIKISADGWEAWISPEQGMNTVSLSFRGEKILRSPPAMQLPEAGTCVYGSPILLPANRTDGGAFSFAGRAYQLPINEPLHHNHIHGSIHTAAFAVDSYSARHIQGHYENRGERYPFPFRLETSYWIEDGYRQLFRIRNIGAGKMPFSFGLHTNFEEKEAFSVEIKWKWEKSDRHIPTGVRLALDERERKYRDGFVFDGMPITGLYAAAGHRARIGDYLYQVSENFDQWTLWNGNGRQGFVSIEPQCGAANALNSGLGLKILDPGQTETFSARICHNMAK